MWQKVKKFKGGGYFCKPLYSFNAKSTKNIHPVQRAHMICYCKYIFHLQLTEKKKNVAVWSTEHNEWSSKEVFLGGGYREV